MMRQKLALVVSGSPSFALKRMNGFSPVKMTRLESAVVMVFSIDRKALRPREVVALISGVRVPVRVQKGRLERVERARPVTWPSLNLSSQALAISNTSEKKVSGADCGRSRQS